MQSFFQSVMGGLAVMMANLVVTAVMGILTAFDLVLSGWLLWGPIVGSASSAPGARDGTGLIFVFMFWLVCTLILGCLAAAIQGTILKSMFPWWEPPEDEVF